MTEARRNKFAILGKRSRFKVLKGGRGSGKSYNVADALILIANACKVKVLCAREFQNSITESVHALLVAQIDKRKLNHRYTIGKSSITNKKTGSEFIFRGLHGNIDSVKSLHGINIVWVEEAQSVSEESWKILIPTIRESGSEIWLTCNPEEEESYLAVRFLDNVNDREILCEEVNYYDNPHFPPELESERLHAQMLIDTAPNDDARAQAQADYDWVWLGKYKKITAAQIMKRVEKKEIPDDPPYGIQIFYGMDFGYAADPNALIRCYILKDCLYITHEAVGRVETDELPTLMRTVPGAAQWPIYADASRPETISAMVNAGFDMSAAEKWNGSVEDGIAFLNSFRRIYVHPRCVTVLEETKKYKYKVDRVSGKVLPIAVDKDNHTWDAIRYGLYTQISHKQGFFG